MAHPVSVVSEICNGSHVGLLDRAKRDSISGSESLKKGRGRQILVCILIMSLSELVPYLDMDPSSSAGSDLAFLRT